MNRINEPNLLEKLAAIRREYEAIRYTKRRLRELLALTAFGVTAYNHGDRGEMALSAVRRRDRLLTALEVLEELAR